MISCQFPDLLHIADHLLISVSLELGQLLHSICVMIHNIGQIRHVVFLSQQQAFKLCQIKENMRTEENYSKDTKERKNTFLLLGSSLGLLLQLGGLILQSRIVLLQSLQPGLQETDLPRLLLIRPLKSSHLLKLPSLVSRQLETLSRSPKELGLLSDLLSQNLSTEHS